jgi:uncharacterized protein YkwD
MDRRKFLAVATVPAVAATAGCSAVQGLLGGGDAPDPDALAAETHDRVNDRRTNHDLDELAYDEDLAAIAEAHSEDMAERGYYDHEDPEGNKWGHRYEEYGYDCAIETDRGTVTGGENLYQIAYSGRSLSATDVAERAVDGWMNSPEHRKNMLQDYWRREGIGVHAFEQDGEQVINVTQNFC